MGPVCWTVCLFAKLQINHIKRTESVRNAFLTFIQINNKERFVSQN